MTTDSLVLEFARGTLLLSNRSSEELNEVVAASDLSRWFVFDERTKQFRAEARHYRDIVTALRDKRIVFTDNARGYERLPLGLTELPQISPRPHQAEALAAWQNHGMRGVVQLPTGAGKTILAVMCIRLAQRPVLVVVPTIDLVLQWQKVLSQFLPGISVGALGGGAREITAVTVSTFDSAVIFAESLGSKFGLLVVDECHHLPAPHYQMIARMSIAPFRLGLSATVDRVDGGEATIFDLLGPLVYEARINEIQGGVLSPYDVVKIEVDLTAAESDAYAEARRVYTDFVRRAGVNFSGGSGWAEFVWKSSRLPGGRDAMRAWREQKRLAQAAAAKLDELWKILREHHDERVIVFTNDNELAYRIGREFMLPVLTHQTKLVERRAFLDAFRSGECPVLVTSKVLNEGVDVPEASVGVVVSGSGGVREHVQRLGRILRHQPGKRATLYELVASGTSELRTLARRRQHHAYQRSDQGPTP